MSQRASGYRRVKRDAYQTPEWVTELLIPEIAEYRDGGKVWEPATGKGQMSVVLKRHYNVTASDIKTGTDFLKAKNRKGVTKIITNPPYNLAEDFINHAFEVLPAKGMIAMLLRVDFDSAKTRNWMFGGNKFFAKKIVLTKRIAWFKSKGSGPSENHAWFIWDMSKRHPAATIHYGPKEKSDG